MAENTEADVATAASISEVLEGGALRAVFQPVIDLTTDFPIGWEGLARVGDAAVGFSRWLDTAAAAGLGTELQLSALHTIVDAGRPPDDALLFVNLSADLIAHPRLFEECDRVGSGVAIDVRGAEIERLGELQPQLADLASAGIHLSIDDTTAASLAMIARVHPSFVKLDAGLVRDIVHDPIPRAVVRAYVAFAEFEDIHIVAEGIERPDQLEVLRDLGVRLGQGFLFGMPSQEWEPPDRHRLRPPVVLDRTRELQRRFAAATDMQAAADVACAELRSGGLLPSFYLERDGVLRCVTQYGYLQMLDGIPVRNGVMSRAFRTGVTQEADVEAPGDLLTTSGEVVSGVAVPVRHGGRVVGVCSVESTGTLRDADRERIHQVALAFEQRLGEVGIVLGDTPMHRLARAKKELSTIDDLAQIQMASTRLSRQVSAMSTALLAMPGKQGLLEIKSAEGPLAVDLRALSGPTLRGLVEAIDGASSCISNAADTGLTRPGISQLRDAGASTLACFSVWSDELGHGMLVLADHAPVTLDFDARESIELLARDVGRTLDMAVVMADLHARATRDTLTGLGNLAAFQEALSAIGGRRKSRWAVAMADVDGFKRVNDTYGHLTGDRILRELAASIDQVLRSEDRMYRIGGDEFAAVIHDVDADGAADVGRRMCEAANAVMGQFGAGLSVGIALPAPYELSTDFLERADQVLYEVKRQAPGTARVAPGIPDDSA